MDTFWVVRDRAVKTYGDFRTRRLILEIYDEPTEAIATGRTRPASTPHPPTPASRNREGA